MKKILLLISLLTLLNSHAILAAGSRSTISMAGLLTEVNNKTRTVVIDGQSYKLRHGVKVYIAGKEVSRSSLFPIRKVQFTTHTNRRTGEIEIKSITVLRL